MCIDGYLIVSTFWFLDGKIFGRQIGSSVFFQTQQNTFLGKLDRASKSTGVEKNRIILEEKSSEKEMGQNADFVTLYDSAYRLPGGSAPGGLDPHQGLGC